MKALLLLTAALAMAPRPTPRLRIQTPIPRPTSPVPLVPAPAATPTVHADRSVTFTLAMPHAEHVEVQVEGFPKPFVMQRATPAADWTYTLPPVPPEFYSYSFLVDGTNVVDPHNVSTKPSAFRLQSAFLVPGHQPWELQDVPSRNRPPPRVHLSDSSSAPAITSSTPHPTTTPRNKYPVLYLLHGYSDEADAWTSFGKANTILDNLIAAGKAKPMVVVMPLGYGDMEMIRRGWIAWQDPALVARNFQLFGQALYSEEIMPRITAEYSLSLDRNDHALAGLSMGGAETLLIGLNHPQDFAWIGAFSAGGIGSANFAPLFPALTGADFNPGNRLLWISVGTEDGLLEPNRKFIAYLRDRGIHPQAIETPGMHAWMVWRDNLANFAPLLFQNRGEIKGS